jgi:hypothetical protein
MSKPNKNRVNQRKTDFDGTVFVICAFVLKRDAH